MAETTGIAWTDSTFNPWMGCTRVSPGCDDCYAARSTPARTLGIAWGPGQPRHRTAASTWAQVKRWNAEPFVQCASCGWRGELRAFKGSEGWTMCPVCSGADWHGARRRVFCASLADVFDKEAPAAWRADLFDLIRATPQLDWLLLTKRIGNAKAMLPDDWGDGYPNVWLGATIVDPDEANRDILKLMSVLAKVRFLSIEPMLGPISLRWLSAFPESHPHTAQHPSGRTDHLDGLRRLSWVICGGESGPKARPMHPGWARTLRDQCAAAGVPFFFKQWGGHTATAGGCELDGVEIKQWPQVP